MRITRRVLLIESLSKRQLFAGDLVQSAPPDDDQPVVQGPLVPAENQQQTDPQSPSFGGGYGPQGPYGGGYIPLPPLPIPGNGGGYFGGQYGPNGYGYGFGYGWSW